MKKSRFCLYTSVIFISVIFISCNTFKTYYGTTFQKIDSKNTSNTYRLDLSNQNLTELPERIYTLKELRMINLSGNTDLHLEKAFETLSTLPNLEVILLDSMAITNLPDTFRMLPKINHISLRYNPDLNFENTVELLQNFDLEFLNLSNNNLNFLPDGIGKLKSLRDLKLSNNQMQLSELFINISNLPRLRSLWLDSNQIQSIPFEINLLDKLVFLYIDDNLLSEFPKEINRLEKLVVLHASGNNFKKLPVELTEMPRIKFAIMANNPIESIPKEFDKRNYSLLALVMDGNKLDEVEKQEAKKMFRRFFIFSAR